MNKIVFKQTVKSNIKLWIMFTFVASVIMAVLTFVFEPQTLDGLSNLVGSTSLLPDTSYLGIMKTSYFSIYGVLLPLVYIILVSNSLIAAQVDQGSMAYLLSTPINRMTVVRTKAYYLIFSLILMFGCIYGSGLLSIHAFQQHVDIDMTKFGLMCLGLFLLAFATAGISFFSSCLFNLSKNALTLGAGLPLAFFIITLLGTLSDQLENMKYFSMNTLFNTEAIMNGESVMWEFIVLIVIGVVLFESGMQVFKRKDLPL